jgi:hypothetical protein
MAEDLRSCHTSREKRGSDAMSKDRAASYEFPGEYESKQLQILGER